MPEQELQVATTEKNGKEYNNIFLKPFRGNTGLEPGNFVIVEKIFVEGFRIGAQYGDIFSCKAKYKDNEVSFILNPRDHDIYKEIGGIGDNVKITLEEETRLNQKTKVKMIVSVLRFELAE